MIITKVMFAANGLDTNVFVFVDKPKVADKNFYVIGRDILQMAFGNVQNAIGMEVDDLEPLTLIEQPKPQYIMRPDGKFELKKPQWMIDAESGNIPHRKEGEPLP